VYGACRPCHVRVRTHRAWGGGCDPPDIVIVGVIELWDCGSGGGCWMVRSNPLLILLTRITDSKSIRAMISGGASA